MSRQHLVSKEDKARIAEVTPDVMALTPWTTAEKLEQWLDSLSAVIDKWVDATEDLEALMDVKNRAYPILVKGEKIEALIQQFDKDVEQALYHQYSLLKYRGLLQELAGIACDAAEKTCRREEEEAEAAEGAQQ